MNNKLYTIEEIQKIVSPIAAYHGVERVFLFGSYARGEATPDSDLDFRVDCGNATDYFSLGLMYGDLEDNSKALCVGKPGYAKKVPEIRRILTPFLLQLFCRSLQMAAVSRFPYLGIPPSFACPQRKEKHFRPLTSWAYPITMQGESLSELFRFVNPL